MPRPAPVKSESAGRLGPAAAGQDLPAATLPARRAEQKTKIPSGEDGEGGPQPPGPDGRGPSTLPIALVKRGRLGLPPELGGRAMCGSNSAVGLMEQEGALWPLLREELRVPAS